VNEWSFASLFFLIKFVVTVRFVYDLCHLQQQRLITQETNTRILCITCFRYINFDVIFWYVIADSFCGHLFINAGVTASVVVAGLSHTGQGWYNVVPRAVPQLQLLLIGGHPSATDDRCYVWPMSTSDSVSPSHIRAVTTAVKAISDTARLVCLAFVHVIIQEVMSE